MKYKASCDGTYIELRAATIEAAAEHAVRRFYGRGLTVRRFTGTIEMSGYFQAYRSVSHRLGGGLTSVGIGIHVF